MLKSLFLGVICIYTVSHLGQGWEHFLIPAGIIVIFLFKRRMSKAFGHAHGEDMRAMAIHEGGHAAAAEALGGKVTSGYISPNGGELRAIIPGDHYSRAVFHYAGAEAEGSYDSASYDMGKIYELDCDKNGARKEARRIVRQEAGRVRYYADKLERNGSL